MAIKHASRAWVRTPIHINPGLKNTANGGKDGELETSFSPARLKAASKINEASELREIGGTMTAARILADRSTRPGWSIAILMPFWPLWFAGEISAQQMVLKELVACIEAQRQVTG